jgi:hypothetical protein
MAKEFVLSPDDLRKLIDYDPHAGKFLWRARDPHWFPSDRTCQMWNTRWAGREAFVCVNSRGYQSARVLGKNVKAHRVAWAIAFGEWPKNQIDHINGDKTDNKISNLRVVTRLTNNKNRKIPSNNTSGVIGVFRQKNNQKWAAQIACNGKRITLGYFHSFDDAVSARRQAERKFGYHKNHGRAA